MKLFNFEEWKDVLYDGLLAYLHNNYELEDLELLLQKKSENLNFISFEEFEFIIKKFGEMSIFKSELTGKIMGDKVWCEYCSLEKLKSVVEEKYFIKIFKKNPSEDELAEALELLIISETIKTYRDRRYREIIKKFLN